MRRTHCASGVMALGLAAAILGPLGTGTARAAVLPEIRTSASNAVPACVTPERLMLFLRSRNATLDPRYKEIARHYKTFGEAWRVRWDYAFFQMAIETNFLSYRQPNGRMGDVDPGQNNFAGIGTTGGGVPGDSFPDVKSGVHAQIQHLVVYSGERLAAPIAPRTKLKQDDILRESLKLERPVRFNDLARRWAVDRNYDRSIEWVAQLFRSRYCRGASAEPAPSGVVTAAGRASASGTPRGRSAAHPAVRTVWTRDSGRPMPAAMASGRSGTSTGAGSGSTEAAAVGAERLRPAPDPALRPAEQARSSAILVPAAGSADAPAPAKVQAPASDPLAKEDVARPAFDPGKNPPAGLGAASCTIGTASYGGSKTVLIKTGDGDRVRYTVLSVLEGFEKSMTESFLKARAPGGIAIGEFASRESALETARTLCPGDPG